MLDRRAFRGAFCFSGQQMRHRAGALIMEEAPRRPDVIPERVTAIRPMNAGRTCADQGTGRYGFLNPNLARMAWPFSLMTKSMYFCAMSLFADVCSTAMG
jgi:hypothetical protein